MRQSDAPFREDEKGLMVAISWQLAVAVRNMHLYEALQREEQARGRLLHSVIGAQEDERKRIARELHDETSQSLAALMMGLDSTRIALGAINPAAYALIESTKAIADDMLTNLHRLISDLRPSLLDDLGLVPAIAWYGEKRLKRLGIKMTLHGDALEERLPATVETALFRIVQEALSNVVRHAAASAVVITLDNDGGKVVLAIEDDGRGFAMRGDQAPASANGHGLGLRGMQERAGILDGWVRIVSAPGHGTRIIATIPCQPPGSAGSA